MRAAVLPTISLCVGKICEAEFFMARREEILSFEEPASVGDLDRDLKALGSSAENLTRSGRKPCRLRDLKLGWGDALRRGDSCCMSWVKIWGLSSRDGRLMGLVAREVMLLSARWPCDA